MKTDSNDVAENADYCRLAELAVEELIRINEPHRIELQRVLENVRALPALLANDPASVVYNEGD